MSAERSTPRRPKTAWLVVFQDTLYPKSLAIEVFTNRKNARAAANELDPGWRSDLCRVYLDEWHESYSEPPLPVEDE